MAFRQLKRIVFVLLFVFLSCIFLWNRRNVNVPVEVQPDIDKKLKQLQNDIKTIKEDMIQMKLKPEDLIIGEEAENMTEPEKVVKYKRIDVIKSFWAGISSDRLYESIFKFETIGNHTTCLISSIECGRKYKLLILITSHIAHFNRRQLIRSTWGSDLNHRWKTYFLVGKSKNQNHLILMKEEIEKYKDIVIGDVNEDFYNLTAKVQAGFEWSVRYCQYEFLLKGDDDIFINMPKIFEFIGDEMTPVKDLYAGNVQYQARVFRDGRYGVSKQEFNRKVYPRYCSGGGFVLSKDSVDCMVSQFFKVKHISIDDAYVGILALKCGIDPLHNDKFRMFATECKFSEDSIIHHPVKEKSCMQSLFKENLKDQEYLSQ